MKLYRTETRFNDLGMTYRWFASKAAAEAYGRDVAKRGDEAGLDDWTVRPVEIPLLRASLVQWLNANLNTDNG